MLDDALRPQQMSTANDICCDARCPRRRDTSALSPSNVLAFKPLSETSRDKSAVCLPPPRGIAAPSPKPSPRPRSECHRLTIEGCEHDITEDNSAGYKFAQSVLVCMPESLCV